MTPGNRMRRCPLPRAFSFLLLVGSLTGCPGSTEELPASPTAPDRVADELVVDLIDGTPLEEFLARHPSLAGLRAAWNDPSVADEAIAVVSLPRARHAAVLAELRGDPLVESAEPNALVALPPAPALPAGLDANAAFIPDDKPFDPLDGFPNDPLYEQQWNMRMVGARDAWRYSTGEGVVVAVLDTGVAYEDEKGVWAPDLDRTRFVPGYDFVNDDPIAADDHGHGTHCAGTIAQSTHNGKGVIGLAPDCKIMPVKVLSAGGWGKVSDIAAAIRWATDHGADVISMSLGGGGYSRVMDQACRYAREHGVAVVCAAGNAGRPRVEYPAAYPSCLAVSAVGPSGKLAFYSSYGKGLFVAAPGGDQSKRLEDGVLQNTLDVRRRGSKKTVYAWFQGTSMATPHVSAACALLYAAGVTRVDAQERMLAATARGDGWNQRTGHGVLDAAAAVRRATFLPAGLALFGALLLAFCAVRKTSPRDLARGLLVLGAVLAASGLFFLRPFGLGELPVVGPLLASGAATWDLVLLGPDAHWNALFASALIPGFLGFTSLATRATRSLGVGIMLGWAARLLVGAALPLADVRWIPGSGVLDALWLAGNAAALLAGAAVVVRLGRGRDARRTP
ncbi:MAG: peptidase S8 [Planctomycetota bacterium]|nr:MAG: peptidase S8 [Planctomycetota bacterium]